MTPLSSQGLLRQDLLKFADFDQEHRILYQLS